MDTVSYTHLAGTLCADDARAGRHRRLLQGGRRLPRAADEHSAQPVSYTHLDVYKRQDVHGVLGVERHGDAPLDGGAGDTGVLQTLLDEGDHLVLAALGLDELGVLLIELEQTVSILAGLEEVGFLVGIVDLAATLGAFAVHQLAVGPEALAGLAVVAGVCLLYTSRCV